MSNWNLLQTVSDVHALDEHSHSNPCLVYKHSTRCAISSMVHGRLERSWDFSDPTTDMYYLDLIANRDVSNFIADHYGVRHESPQALLIYRGKCVYHNSHMGIQARRIREQVSQTTQASHE